MKEIRLADVKRIWEHVSGRPLVSGSAAHHFAKALLEEAGVHFEDCPFGQEHNEAVLWCRPCQYDRKKWPGNPDDLPPSEEPIADAKGVATVFRIKAHYRQWQAPDRTLTDAHPFTDADKAREYAFTHYPSAYKIDVEPVRSA